MPNLELAYENPAGPKPRPASEAVSYVPAEDRRTALDASWTLHLLMVARLS